MNREQQIEDFFSGYERNFNELLSGKSTDFTVISESFTSCIMGSGPEGVVCATNDSEFINRIKQGFEFYKKIGTKGMNILKTDTELLDEDHVMSKVSWRYSAIKEGKEVAIAFMVIYLLQTTGGSIKIFTYITGDEQRILKEYGLV